MASEEQDGEDEYYMQECLGGFAKIAIAAGDFGEVPTFKE